MSEKIYFLMILCGTLCQGIIARESSDVLVRKRRVINQMPIGGLPTAIENANYMVRIQENNRLTCSGVILSHYTVLVSAPCIRYDKTAYRILSGASASSRGKIHTIATKTVHYGNAPHQRYDTIALLNVEPLFVYDGAKTGNIDLYEGPLMEGEQVTIFGWGCSYPLRPVPAGRRVVLRHITIPIMDLQECHNIYQGAFGISEKHICTYDEQKYCARGDAGAPLVIQGRLAGIHIWKGEREGHINPDVFLNLQRPDYSVWIRQNTLNVH